jgi:hypothetical protein
MNGSLRARVIILVLLSLFLAFKSEEVINSTEIVLNQTEKVKLSLSSENSTTINESTGNMNTTAGNITESIVNNSTHLNETITNIFNTTNSSTQEQGKVEGEELNKNFNLTGSLNNMNVTMSNNITHSETNQTEQIVNSTTAENLKESGSNYTDKNITTSLEGVNINSTLQNETLTTSHTSDSSLHASQASDSQKDTSKIINIPYEAPVTQNQTPTPNEEHKDSNLDRKWEEFNLTNEIERLYNSSRYEESEEEKLIRDAEKVQAMVDQEEDSEEVRLRKEWEQEVTNFDATDILTVKLKSNKHFVKISFNYILEFLL